MVDVEQSSRLFRSQCGFNRAPAGLPVLLAALQQAPDWLAWEAYGRGILTPGFSVYAAAESGRRGFHRRAAGALEYLSPRAIHGRARPRSENQAAFFYGSASHSW